MKKEGICTKGIIFDIDGVLEFKGMVCEGAVETVNTLRERGMNLRFLTNSTLKSRKSCAEMLCEEGFVVTMDEVITASYATSMYLKSQNPRSCWVMLEREGLDEFKDFYHDRENPEYIVIGDYRNNFTFENLNRALRLLMSGATLVGMMGELVDTQASEPELNVGSWVQMLERASGVRATYIGKPNPYVFNLALRGMNLEAWEVAMVGDRMDTDIAGAINAGMCSILIKTGEYRERDLLGTTIPDHVLNSIRELAGLFYA